MKTIYLISLLLPALSVFAQDTAPFPTSCIWCLAKAAESRTDLKWSTSQQKCLKQSTETNLITTFEECYKNGQTSKFIIDDSKKADTDSEVKLRFDMPYNKTNEWREVLWIFKNNKETDLDINFYCLGERRNVTAYGYSANETSSIVNI